MFLIFLENRKQSGGGDIATLEAVNGDNFVFRVI